MTMSLDAVDLKKIENVIDRKVTKIVDERIIKIVTKIVDERISQSEQRVIKTLTREINDVAEIIHAFIDKFDNHEHRIKRLEVKVSTA